MLDQEEDEFLDDDDETIMFSDSEDNEPEKNIGADQEYLEPLAHGVPNNAVPTPIGEPEKDHARDDRMPVQPAGVAENALAAHKHKRHVWTSGTTHRLNVLKKSLKNCECFLINLECLEIALSLMLEYPKLVPQDRCMGWVWMRDEIFARGHQGKFHQSHLETPKKLHQCERSVAAWLLNGKRDKNEMQRREPPKELTDEEKLWLASSKNPFNRKK
jgi:hypothetical protein